MEISIFHLVHTDIGTVVEHVGIRLMVQARYLRMRISHQLDEYILMRVKRGLLEVVGVST